MQEPTSLDWRSEFSDEELATLRSAIPSAIHRSQDRSARAHTEYQDPDGEQDVYGVGMARGAQKELQALIKGMDRYREQRVPGSRRVLPYVGDTLLFLQRVGKQMPRNHRRYRLSYLPEQRRDVFLETSNVKYTEPGGLFDLPRNNTEDGDDVARLSDILDIAGDTSNRLTLIVPYYSSTPFSVGTMYWAPARLNGRYLEFTDPERLTFARQAGAEGAMRSKPRPAGGFADGQRPRTPARLRPRPEGEKGHN
ncbi:hypothetical protein [Agromyces sp. GXQ0307]|uniref:hypothetical protein n=1 Tax=Agromyces sp. GXQ0307 TaxID=3377835 RepID=UPI00383AE7B2